MDLKETKEVLTGVEALAVAIIERTGDGIGVDDAIALATDSALRAKVTAAVNGISGVHGELKDLSLDEIAELVPEATKIAIGIIKALRVAADKRKAA